MKKVNGRCAALDSDGRQCRRQGSHAEQFHGNPEMMGWPHENHPNWVKVWLCDKHWRGPEVATVLVAGRGRRAGRADR